MDQMEDKLGAILGNPQLMQQIMSMAQNLSGQSPPPTQTSAPSSLPDFDPAFLKALSGFAMQGNVDQNQQALLSALHPYLSRAKLSKLERAMRAARLARAASGFLGQGGLQLLTGR